MCKNIKKIFNMQILGVIICYLNIKPFLCSNPLN